MTAPAWRTRRLLFSALAVALIASHWPVLRLPYFWDEAGYYIPAAHDLYLTGSLIPQSTLSNAHPPLVIAYLALAWKLFGHSPLVTRVAMLMIASLALMAVFELMREIAGAQVALAAMACTAVYPVFFAQSSLAHLDMAAAAGTLWGVLYYLRRRFAWAALWFALAALAKETAILAPAALWLWEMCAPQRFLVSLRRPAGSLWLPISAAPLAGWYAYHHARTGFFFGNPEFLRYNVGATLNLYRAALAFLQRGWQLFGHMQMFVLTVAAAVAMFFPPQRDKQGRVLPRIAIPAQLAFGALILAYWLALSLIGGAELSRYLLPVLPLIIIISVSTIRRRVQQWPMALALICAAFVVGLVVNPPYIFAPEDNLAYRDFVELQQGAADFLTARDAGARVLTAWPATDELSKPWLGYVQKPLRVMQTENFSATELQAAAQNANFDVALVFSTKYEPPRRLWTPQFWKRAQVRFFGYHKDVSPAEAAQLLGGQIVFEKKRGGQWIAVIAAELRDTSCLGCLYEHAHVR